jgi:replicative DNA helicase
METETALLSAVMLGDKAATKVFAILEPRHFCCEAHQTVFEAMVALDHAEMPTDVVQVATWLKKRKRLHEIGGMEYLATLLNRASSVPNVVAWARSVQNFWRNPCVTP